MPITFADLVTALDPTGTGAAYHYAINPTLSGGRLVSLPDALGRAGVPALTGGGSPLPAYDATNGITTDGAQNYLDSGLSSRFDFSSGPLTVIYCGTTTAPGHTCIIHEDTNSRWFSIGRLSSLDSFIRSQNGGGSTGNPTVVTPFAFDASPHLYVAQLSETARPAGYGWFGLVADPYPRYLHNGDDVTVTTNMAAGSNHIEFGRLSGAGQFNADTLRWLIVLRKDVTLADLRLVRQFAATDATCVPFSGSTLSRAIYFIGDSLTYGFRSSDPSTKSAPARLAASGVINGYEWRNWAQGGRRATTWQAQWDGLVVNEARDDREKQWIVCWIGTNDIQSDSISAASLIAIWQDIGSRARAGGFKVAFASIINRGDFSAANSSVQAAANAWLTGSAVGGGYADVVIDLAADSRLQTPSNTTYFNADQIHLTDAGYQVVADLMQAQLAGTLGENGALSTTLVSPRLSAAATVWIQGAAGGPLVVPRVTAAGALAIHAAGTATLALLRGQGTSALLIRGGLSATAGALRGAGSATVSSPITGAATPTLAEARLVAAAQLEIRGGGTASVPAPRIAISGAQLAIHGAATTALPGPRVATSAAVLARPSKPAGAGGIHLCVGDTTPPITATLLINDRVTPQNLLGATVTLEVRNAVTGAVLFTGRPVTLLDAARGRVQYDWQSDDTATPGRYEGRFHIVYADGTTESFPNGHDGFRITIHSS